MYTFEPDRPRGLLRIALSGFWSAETARDFAVDQQAAVAALGCANGQHVVLVDLSAFKIQSQEVVKLCKAFIEGATNSSRRLALVGGEGLARIQSKRVLGRDEMRIFDSVRDAERWLLEPTVAANRGQSPSHPTARDPSRISLAQH